MPKANISRSDVFLLSPLDLSDSIKKGKHYTQKVYLDLKKEIIYSNMIMQHSHRPKLTN